MGIDRLTAMLPTYPNALSSRCAVFGGVAALEMLAWAIKDVVKMSLSAGSEVDANRNKNLSANLAGAALYGLCALNPFPYSPILGALGFAGYSVYKKWTAKESDIVRDKYYLSRMIGETADFVVVDGCKYIGKMLSHTYTFIGNGATYLSNITLETLKYVAIKGLQERVFDPLVSEVLKPCYKHILKPFYDKVLVPLAGKIRDFVGAIFASIVSLFSWIPKFQLTSNLTWKCVALVVLITGVYQSYKFLPRSNL